MDTYGTMKRVIEHIVERRLEHASLEELGASFGMSPGHLQKLFTKWAGISPKQFGRYLSLGYAKALLEEDAKTLAAAARTGLSGGGRLHDLFVGIEAMTPGEYRARGKGLSIRYSVFPSPFGTCLAASTDRGICAVLFLEAGEDAEAQLKERWPLASFVRKAEPSHAALRQYLEGASPASEIRLHLRGTSFQIKVWEALLSIPEGRIATYAQIAEKAGAPGASRAAGTAIGDNPVAFLIPCHRVLRSTGQIGGYRWGESRKRAMLAYEALRREAH